WLVAQLIVENTKALGPLVAVQPVYMHPYAVAVMVASFAYIHGRRIYLNMVAGGFKNDLAALCDDTPHDQRYERIHEYTTIILELLRNKTLNFKGKFYQVLSLKMAPPMSQELFLGVFMSGLSDAGMVTARALGVTAVDYQKPIDEYGETS